MVVLAFALIIAAAPALWGMAIERSLRKTLHEIHPAPCAIRGLWIEGKRSRAIELYSTASAMLWRAVRLRSPSRGYTRFHLELELCDQSHVYVYHWSLRVHALVLDDRYAIDDVHELNRDGYRFTEADVSEIDGFRWIGGEDER